MKYSHIVWDFNGTILDDIDACIASENILLMRRNMPLINGREHYYETFCFPIINYYKKLGHDFEKESFDTLAHEWVAEYLINVKNSRVHSGVIEMINFFSKENITQIVLSATETNMLKRQLMELGLAEFFNEMLGLDNIYANSKENLAINWFKAKNPESVLFIGDTEHDLHVANSVGADCILVEGGHQGEKTLNSTGAIVVKNVIDIKKYIY